MKTARFLLAGVLCAMATTLHANDPDWNRVATAVSNILERGHFSQKPLDDAVSEKTLELYLESLDHSRLFFTAEDVKQFERKYATRLDDMTKAGDLTAAREVFDVYKRRVQQRVAKINALLKFPFTFDSNRTTELKRDEATWPANEAEADRLWRDRIEHEVLTERLREISQDSDTTIAAAIPRKTPVETVQNRYKQLLRNVDEQGPEEVTKTYLSALSQAYDPHSEYLSPSELENFEISMSQSLLGIGAVLKSEDGYARIVELVQGGPAATDGRLRVNDRIASVGQGKNSQLVDVVDMKLDKVVQLIRGKKDSIVRLEVIPSGVTDPSKREIIEITRDEITLKDSLAKGQLIELNNEGGKTFKLGWITLPSFYKDMNSVGPSARSTTRDVTALIDRMKKDGMDGLVFDLRTNGGGSLDEAVDLTGLFIKSGPVVQALNTEGIANVSQDRNNRILYDGPLVVLTSRVSASASEIFAAALQDYGRALVIGEEHTYGKGTVQTMVEISRFLSPFGLAAQKAGALKLTVQKFYRIAGGSTQHKGVMSDIILPSPLENLDVGESKMKNALPYDETNPVKYTIYSSTGFPLEALRGRSATRIAKEPEFIYMKEDASELKATLAANAKSLNEAVRRAELKKSEDKVTARQAERLARKVTLPKAYRVTLDDVEKPALEEEKFLEKGDSLLSLEEAEEAEPTKAEDGTTKEAALPKGPLFDPVKLEALQILSDLIELSQEAKTAKAP